MVFNIKNGLLPTAVFLFALASLASLAAATADDEASYFIRGGENASAVDINNGYQMVLISGVETAVLKQDGEEFSVVQDDAGIKTAVDAYATKSYEDLKPLVPQVMTAFEGLQQAIDTCIVGSEWFSFNATRGGVYVRFNVRYDPAHFPREYGAIWFIDKNVKKFKADWQKAEDGVSSLQASLSDEEKALQAAANVRDGFTPVQNQYPKYYEAYLNATSSNQFAYQFNGIDHPCASTSNVTGKINSILSIIGSSKFNPPSVMFDTVKNRTNDRAREAAANKLKTGASTKASSLSKKVEALKQNYSLYSIDLKGLAKDLLSLQGKVGTAGFDNASNNLAKKIDKYKALSGDYNRSREAIYKANEAIQKAVDRYGSTDGRVVDLKSQIDKVKLDLKNGEKALTDGTIDTVDFKKIEADAKAITENAGNLQAKENQIDLVTVAAVLVFIIAIAGGIWYYRKQQEPPFGGGAGSLPSSPSSSPAPKQVDLKDIDKM